MTRKKSARDKQQNMKKTDRIHQHGERKLTEKLTNSQNNTVMNKIKYGKIGRGKNQTNKRILN